MTDRRRILILGGTGMLGHKLWQCFQDRFDCYVTFRGAINNYEHFGIFDLSRSIGGVSVQDFGGISNILQEIRPDVVVNCIGIVKQSSEAKYPIPSIEVNALYPHKLAHACEKIGARVIHVSTDCVFAGTKGKYRIEDFPDANDLYGRTKLLGEIAYENALTVRTSIIGRELVGAFGLVEWFLSQSGNTIKGFRNAIFSGFTTLALANTLADIIVDYPKLNGIWQVASNPIDKFTLLSLVRDAYSVPIVIEEETGFYCDRSLDGTPFQEATGFKPADWPAMITEMQADLTPYDEIRNQYVNR